MHSSAERRSPRATAIAAVLVALTCAPARGQSPLCGWGDGVTLPGCIGRTMLIASDGAGGVLAVSVSATGEDVGGPTSGRGALRLHHILEQGRLDPNLPAEGAVFFVPAAGTTVNEHPRSNLARVLPDGAGGAWVLVGACNPFLAHLRCYEVGIARLLHVTAAGTLYPGWPAEGIVLPASPTPALPGVLADMVEDGAGGVVVVWLQQHGTLTTVATRAQRFGPDGSPLWSGGLEGHDVLPTDVPRSALLVASDHAGGAVAVVNRTDLASGEAVLATRVLANGERAWGVGGVPVLDVSTASEHALGLTVDEFGYTFVATAISDGSGRHLGVQSIDEVGIPQFGPSGFELGPVADAPASLTSLAEEHVMAWFDTEGSVRYQRFDFYGTPLWGDALAGLPANWAGYALPRFFPLSAGHVLALASATPAFGTSFVRALEFDATGTALADWPDSGAVVCGTEAGLVLADALVMDGQMFVALGSTDGPYFAPKLQRLTRPVLGAPPTLLPQAALELSAPSPNPVRGSWTARFALREAADVTLELLDVAGRRVLIESLGRYESGSHAVVIEAGGQLAPGVYRMRVRTTHGVAERILVRVR